MTNTPEMPGAKAQVDFMCLDDACGGVVKFNLSEVADGSFQSVTCPKCGRVYALDAELRGKLLRMLKLVLAIRDAEDVLGDSNVSVSVAGGSVKIPYALLLTRLNTLLSLKLEGKPVDFHLWIEPTSPDTFR